MFVKILVCEASSEAFIQLDDNFEDRGDNQALEVKFYHKLPLGEWDEVDCCEDGHIGVHDIYLKGFEAGTTLILGDTGWQIGSSHTQDDI